MVGVGQGFFDRKRGLMFLSLALLLGQLGTGLTDSQVHRRKDDPWFKGLAFDNKSKVIPPNGGQDSAEQEKDRDVIVGFDGVGVWEKEAANIVCGPASFLHISRK
jgi:hypothetical protein